MWNISYCKYLQEVKLVLIVSHQILDVMDSVYFRHVMCQFVYNPKLSQSTGGINIFLQKFLYFSSSFFFSAASFNFDIAVLATPDDLSRLLRIESFLPSL